MHHSFRIETRKKKGDRPEYAWRWSIETAQEHLAAVIATRRRRKNPQPKDIKDARALIKAAEAKGSAEMFKGKVILWFRPFH